MLFSYSIFFLLFERFLFMEKFHFKNIKLKKRKEFILFVFVSPFFFKPNIPVTYVNLICIKIEIFRHLH